MKTNLRVLVLLLLTIFIFSGCARVPDNTTPSALDSDKPIQINWNMPAYLVDASGNVSDGFELNATGEILKLEEYTRLDVLFKIEGDLRYSFPYSLGGDTGGHGQVCKDILQVNSGDYVTEGYVYDKTENAPAWAVWAVNTEKEYFLSWFGEEFGQYMVASTDPNVKPEEILEHFTWFLDYVAKAHK